MSGVKGKSGGARPGAGRKPNPPPISSVTADSPLDFLMGVMKDETADLRVRIQAAQFALPYCHPKLGEGGKKDRAADKAKAASEGKFKSGQPPKLVVSNGRS